MKITKDLKTLLLVILVITNLFSLYFLYSHTFMLWNIEESCVSAQVYAEGNSDDISDLQLDIDMIKQKIGIDNYSIE